MSIPNRISVFFELGRFFHYIIDNEVLINSDKAKFDYLKDDFYKVLSLAEAQNPWFTQENIRYALKQWSMVLTKENLVNWINKYPANSTSKNVGIIMAGNVPIVGFHDLLAVLLAGHTALVKLSSKDKALMSFVIQFLQDSDEEFIEAIQKVKRLENHDAVIATGSNNTSRYFEYYFKEKPHIIRKNRTSVAILNGNESQNELKNLADDIFLYFGLGCRNITHIFLPIDFKIDVLFENFYHWNSIINHPKYANNYDYNRAIFLLAQEKFLDNNFMILKESDDLFSPIGVVHYSFYNDLDTLNKYLSKNQDQLQCMVGKEFELSFGESQKPSLTDYADGVDTMQFLVEL